MYLPSVTAITLTCGRFQCIRRALSCFLDQDYQGDHTMLIFNNAKVPYSIADLDLPANKHVILVNNYTNSKTGKPYKSLGEIHLDALNFVPESTEVIYHQDDDDLILPNHISEGVKGLERSGKMAYKPKQSWYLDSRGHHLMENTMEPSIFIEANFLRAHGYNEVNVSAHLKWVHALMTVEQIASDPEGVPTLIYCWGIDQNVFKTSGAGETPTNFANYRAFSQDFGNQTITPLSRDVFSHFLKVPA